MTQDMVDLAVTLHGVLEHVESARTGRRRVARIGDDGRPVTSSLDPQDMSERTLDTLRNALLEPGDDVLTLRGPDGREIVLDAVYRPGGADANRATMMRKLASITTVDASWFSNINDAIAAANRGGSGGVVRIPKNTGINQTGYGPARLTSGVVIEGEDPVTSILENRTPGEAAIAVAVPASGADRPTVRNLRIWGNNTADVGIDWRGITRGLIENVEVSGFTDTQMWFGGDYPTYAASWIGTVNKARITAPSNGAGMRFSGKVLPGGGPHVGAPTANRFSLYDIAMIGLSLPGSIGVDLVEGDTNTFFGGDIGYGTTGTVFKLGQLAIANRFIGGVSEDVAQALDCEGTRNQFIGWQFPSSSTLTMRNAAQDQWFIGCPYLGTIVEENPSWNRTRVIGPTASHFHVPTVTSLPAAGAAHRGKMVYLLSGSGVPDELYVCVKNASDGYGWRKASWA